MRISYFKRYLTIAFLLIVPLETIWASNSSDTKPGPSIGQFLNEDGKFYNPRGYNGSIDISGYAISFNDNAPEFRQSSNLNDPNDNWTLHSENPGVSGGEINVLVVFEDDLYVGGIFRSAGGIKALGIARFNMESNSWFALGDGIDGRVDAIAIHDDNIYVGGNFEKAGEVSSNNIAGYNIREGSWFSMDGGVSCENIYCVSSLIVYGNDLYVGGSFIGAGDINSRSIARYNLTNETWYSLNGEINGSVYAFALSGDDIFVGGVFVHAENDSIKNLARYNIEENSWSSSGIENTHPINALAISGNDLYVGGSFFMTYPLETRGIARYDMIQESWHAIDKGINGDVYALTVLNDQLYVGGYLRGNIGYGGSGYIARFDLNTMDWNELGWDTNYTIKGLAISGNELFFGGNFSLAASITCSRIAMYSTVDNNVYSLGKGLTGLVTALAVYEDYLYIGGFFSGAGEVSANNIIRYNISNNSYHALDFELNNGVRALELRGDDLYIGGWFTNTGPQNIKGILRYNLNGKSLHPLGDGIDYSVESILIYGKDIYVGTNYYANVFRFNMESQKWYTLGDGIGGYPYDTIAINALAIKDGNLYAGGHFYTAGGNAVNNIARYNILEEKWYALGEGVFGERDNSRVTSFAVAENNLFIGGSFTNAGDIEANNIVRYNIVEEKWYALENGLNGWVDALEIVGDHLIVGGFFTKTKNGDVNNDRLNGIAYYDIQRSSWHSMGHGLENFLPWASAPATSFTRVDRDLYVGGNFVSAGGKPASRIARWAIPENFDIPDKKIETPASIVLRQNYPNPFNTNTQITYGLSELSEVRLEIYNIIGQYIATLTNSYQDPGWYTVNFDAQQLSSGVYICRITANGIAETIQMTLIK